MNNGPERVDPIAPGGGDGTPAEASLDAALEAQLEQALRRALRPEDPPMGFRERVLAEAGVAPSVPVPASRQPATGKLLRWRVRRLWIGGVVAAALVLGCVEGEEAWQRLREQQRRVAAATAQFETTERVTVHALAQAKEQLQRAGVPLTLD